MKKITREELEVLEESMTMLNPDQKIKFIEKQLSIFYLDDSFMKFNRYIDIISFSSATFENVGFLYGYEDLFDETIWAEKPNKNLNMFEDERFFEFFNPELIPTAFRDYDPDTLTWNVYNNIKDRSPETAELILPRMMNLIDDGSFVYESKDMLSMEFFEKNRRITFTTDQADFAIGGNIDFDLFLAIIFNTKDVKYILEKLDNIPPSVNKISVYPPSLAIQAMKTLKGNGVDKFINAMNQYASATFGYVSFLESILLYGRNIDEATLKLLKPYFLSEDLGSLITTYARNQGFKDF